MKISPATLPAITSVSIRTIPHDEQRYETCGDYQWEDGHLAILVSDTGDWRETMTVALHEMVEALLCYQRGVTEVSISDFDQQFTGDEDEPGEQPEAPYREEHLTATVVERLMAFELGLHWPAYEQHIYALEWRTGQKKEPSHGSEPEPGDGI